MPKDLVCCKVQRIILLLIFKIFYSASSHLAVTLLKERGWGMFLRMCIIHNFFLSHTIDKLFVFKKLTIFSRHIECKSRSIRLLYEMKFNLWFLEWMFTVCSSTVIFQCYSLNAWFEVFDIFYIFYLLHRDLEQTAKISILFYFQLFS